jgi:hypothetical protein
MWHSKLSSFLIILQTCYKKIASAQPSATRPLFERISISANSSKRSTTNSCWNFEANDRNGDSLKKWGELPMAASVGPTHHMAYHAIIFCDHLANLLQKIRISRTQSTESPILFRSYGHETRFYDQKGASKIGDSVLWFRALVGPTHHMA